MYVGMYVYMCCIEAVPGLGIVPRLLFKMWNLCQEGQILDPFYMRYFMFLEDITNTNGKTGTLMSYSTQKTW